MNVAEIETQLSDLVEQPFDASKFPFQLLEIYKAPKATLTKLRKGTQNKGEQPGDVLWARKLSFRPALAGQVEQTLDALKDAKATKSQKPRFLFTTDGKELSALDLKTDETLHCDFVALNDHFDFFLPLAGIDKYEAVKENPADIKATGRLAKFHDEIVRHNPEWNTNEKRHALNQFMTRILFCMFAEDTGSFPKDIFVKTITEFGGDDGEHLQSLLRQIFDAMNIPGKERRDVPAHINAFPYVNGGLFSEASDVPAFNKRAKRILIEAAQLDWREINPDIFGSMIQAIVHPDMRGDLGMHYTSVPNIMKVLQPLFLMSLEEEFADAHGHREERSRLSKLLTRISKIRVFDPACGSGNFLIIAYRELRTLEMRILKRVEDLDAGQRSGHWTGVKLSHFHGIELADFAAETAKLSLWIAEYQMNQRFKGVFGEAPPNFPLTDGGHIVCGNALRLDWHQLCPRPTKMVRKQKVFDLATIVPVHGTEEVIDDEAETYIVGNPPYVGGKKQSKEQKTDMMLVFGAANQHKNLDYICAFFKKGAEYLQGRDKLAFVTTNSVNQGTHVPTLWPQISAHDVEIFFGYAPFSWSNNAANNAGVTCTIIGLRKDGRGPKHLFGEDTFRIARNINYYLVDGPNLIVETRSSPLSSVPRIITGNAAYDGGHLFLNEEQRADILRTHPEAEDFILRVSGTSEFIDGDRRWCFWIDDEQLSVAERIPAVRDRIGAVLKYREDGGEVAQTLTDKPHQFRYRNRPEDAQILIPQVSSERRHYIPIGLLDRSTIITHLAFAIYDPDMATFSILNSTLHNIWVRAICGQLETRIRYSTTLGYNTFPVPDLSRAQTEALEAHAWEIISQRDNNPGRTIAWLYDPDTMPSTLLDAHCALDSTLERIYVGRPFRNDSERLECLFELYAEMTAEKEQQEAANA